MTEEEWQTATDPTAMLAFLQDKASDRKLRLFAVACCRRAWDLLCDRRSQEAVIAAEAYADRGVGDDILEPASIAALEAAKDCRMVPARRKSDWAEMRKLWSAAWAAVLATVPNGPDEIGLAVGSIARDVAKCFEGGEPTVQAMLSRDIFANPFRPVRFTPSWHRSEILTLAAEIYHNRAFDRMPILADALQDAGCDSDDILTHCRGGGPHVRGCYVVDLLLGKS